MELNHLTLDSKLAGTSKIEASIKRFQNLLNAIEEHQIPESLVQKINEEITQVNKLSEKENITSKELSASKKRILKRLEKELKLVPKHYYRSLWMVLGLASFGIPIGVVLGTSLGNMAFLGSGMPIGMVIGMALGSRMDQKAALEGRQLNIE